jgi:hypothetical protein
MFDVRRELIQRGIQVGPALYEKCLFGSGIYPLGERMVVKAELTNRNDVRMMKESINMLKMARHGIGPNIHNIGSFKVRGGDKSVQILFYIIMEKYVLDLGVLEKEMPSTLFDSISGFMINRLFKQVAYATRMILTDLKPQNIVANLDLVFTPQSAMKLRIVQVGLIDFGPDYSSILPTHIHSKTAHTSMILLYFAISSALGFTRCAETMLPFIKRRSQDDLNEAVTWMNSHPLINKSTRQYISKTSSVSDIYIKLLQSIREKTEQTTNVYEFLPSTVV